MTTTTFDTLAFSEELRAAGVPEMQAKAHAKALSAIASEKLVSQEYLDTRLKELEYRLTLRLGGMMAASVAVVAALVKLL
ncbi:MAG: DUF1640 domain-containing protein [Magnetococcales bacterium]|nr:DUF1640 domain-containing protein [Magnetococcales bacterium]